LFANSFLIFFVTFSERGPLAGVCCWCSSLFHKLGDNIYSPQHECLDETRLATVLITAATLDDIVGLIMVHVIPNVGSSASSFSSVTVIRPVAVSIGFVVVLLLACRLVIKPLTLCLNKKGQKHPTGILQRLSSRSETAIIIQTSFLLGMVSGASFAGSSDLFAACLAGATISWFYMDVLELPQDNSPAGMNATKDEDVSLGVDGQSSSILASQQSLELDVHRRSSAGRRK